MKLDTGNWTRPSLTRNVILYVVLMSLVPLITLGAISYWGSRSAVRERAQRYISEIMTEKKNYLNLLMRDVESLMLSLASQEDIRQMLQDQVANRNLGNDFERLSTQAKIGYVLSEYVNLDGILSIDLFSTGGVHYHVGETLVAGEVRKSTQELLFSEAVQSERPVVWIGMVDSVMVGSHHPKTIAAVKVIEALDIETGEELPIGFLVVSYDMEVLHQKFQHAGHTGQICRILDQRYQIVCDPDMANIGKTLDPLLKNRMNAQTGAFRTEVDGEDTLVFYDRSEETGWVLMNSIPTERIDEQIDAIAGNTLWAIVISTVLAVLFILHFSRQVVSPIRDITERFKKIQAGRPESEMHLAVASLNEIGELARWFNTFLDSQVEKRRTEAELIQSKAELQCSHELLEIRVAERTQELNVVNQALRNEIIERKHAEDQRQELEARLRQSQKMEAIGTLAGGIAHDFNNILSAVIGYTELAQMKLDAGSEIRDHLKQVITAGVRAKDLVNQILAFSRQTQKEKMPVQMSLIVKEALKLIRSSLPVTIDIRQNIQSQSVILSDPTQLHQIVMNLCTNAAYAMRGRDGILDVTLTDVELDSSFCSIHPEIQPGAYQKLMVSDNGKGMAADVMNRIFDPFFTTKPRGEGTGLGLSVVHGIVKDFAGTITVFSEPDKGTTFDLYFPIIKGRLEEKPEEQTIIPTGTERILLVDDEKPIIDMIRISLSSLGYAVEARTSSLAALELFRAMPGRFDLVITDMTMPQMAGDTLAREMMQIRPDLPVILCTGFSENITREKAEKMGIKAFLLKPLLKRELAHTIRSVLDEAKCSTPVLLSHG